MKIRNKKVINSKYREVILIIITKIEPYKRKDTYKLEVDYEYAFWLYKSELKKYGLRENQEINQEIYNELLEENVLYRAKQKALNLLKYMGRTEKELRQKLKLDGYKEEIVNKVIDYVYEYNYLDDKQYAEQFVLWKKNKKSKRQIKMELENKGISNEIIEHVMQENNDSDALKLLISKKMKNKDSMSEEEKRKLASYLYRKGFEANQIWRELNHI